MTVVITLGDAGARRCKREKSPTFLRYLRACGVVLVARQARAFDGPRSGSERRDRAALSSPVQADHASNTRRGDPSRAGATVGAKRRADARISDLKRAAARERRRARALCSHGGCGPGA